MAAFKSTTSAINLLGLTGADGVGKNEIAERLFAVHGFVPTEFADPLRKIASEAFGVDDDDFVDLDKVNGYWDMTPRQMLQETWARFGSEFWVRRWGLMHAEFRDVASSVVTDVCDEVTAEAIRDAGGVIVHVSRPGIDALPAVEFADGDLTLDNDGDIRALFAKVDALALFTVNTSILLAFT